jgi:hypothetical protein
MQPTKIREKFRCLTTGDEGRKILLLAHHISTGTVNTYSLTAAAIETIIGLDGK